jgi:hypothetical protein
LYKTQSEVIQKSIKPIASVFQEPSVVEKALADDLESHRVMYQYMFVENKKKSVAPEESES